MLWIDKEIDSADAREREIKRDIVLWMWKWNEKYFVSVIVSNANS